MKEISLILLFIFSCNLKAETVAKIIFTRGNFKVANKKLDFPYYIKTNEQVSATSGSKGSFLKLLLVDENILGLSNALISISKKEKNNLEVQLKEGVLLGDIRFLNHKLSIKVNSFSFTPKTSFFLLHKEKETISLFVCEGRVSIANGKKKYVITKGKSLRFDKNNKFKVGISIAERFREYFKLMNSKYANCSF